MEEAAKFEKIDDIKEEYNKKHVVDEKVITQI